jgi:hypothetical protein
MRYLACLCVMTCLLPAASCAVAIEPDPSPDGRSDVGEGEGEGEGEGDNAGEGEGEGEPGCDADADGDGACADLDCDDNESRRYPGNTEHCDFIDNDCDDSLNNDLDCTFVAHSGSELFRVDPFAETVTPLGTVTGGSSILDMDIDVDGTLLGVTFDGVVEITSANTLELVADIDAPSGTNGLAITGEGTLFLTTFGFGDAAAWRFDRPENTLTQVGVFPAGISSSGDCVVTKEEDLLMSARDDASPTDILVEITAATGATTTVGPIGFSGVFGLSASFDFLFGVTELGEVLLIDRDTGAGELLFDTGFVFFGAANGD